MAWRYNPFTDTFQYYNSATELEAKFLKLDASNGPVTEELCVSPVSTDVAIKIINGKLAFSEE